MSDIKVKSRNILPFAFVIVCVVLLYLSQSKSKWGTRLLSISPSKVTEEDSTSISTIDNGIIKNENDNENGNNLDVTKQSTSTTTTSASKTEALEVVEQEAVTNDDEEDDDNANLEEVSANASKPTVTSLTPMTPYPEPEHLEKCVLYDRPPRTGSSTIGTALYECFRHKGYYILPSMLRKFEKMEGRRYIVSELLSVRKRKKAVSVKGHLTLTKQDTDKISKYCDDFLYISSTGPILKRIMSQVKYSLVHGHGNNSVGINRLINLTQTRGQEHVENQEMFLEKYPYHINDSSVTEDNRLVPHYIIRQEFLEEDLVPLMTAMQCPNRESVASQNVHGVFVNTTNMPDVLNTTGNSSLLRENNTIVDADKLDVSMIFQEIQANLSSYLRANDFRYRRMLELAETNNPSGLIHAEKF